MKGKGGAQAGWTPPGPSFEAIVRGNHQYGIHWCEASAGKNHHRYRTIYV
jgi:hypothetical protein